MKTECIKLSVSFDKSPPSRRRGLKTTVRLLAFAFAQVASFAEAWIENAIREQRIKINMVASFAEAWIENKGEAYTWQDAFRVASFAEAWIENAKRLEICTDIMCRLLRGGVD